MIAKIKRAVFRPFFLGIGSLITVLVLSVWWIQTDSNLDPAEEAALDFVYYSMVKYEPGNLENLLVEKEKVELYDIFDRSIPSSSQVFIGTQSIGYGKVKVVIFLENPTDIGNRIEIKLKQIDSQWKVVEADPKGDQKRFESFKQTPYYRGLGIEEWKNIQLSDS